MFAYLASVLASVTLTQSDIVHLKDNYVRVSDVINVEDLGNDIDRKISKKIILQLKIEQKDIKLTRQDIADLLQRRIPGLNGLEPDNAQDSIHFRKMTVNESRHFEDRVCFATLTPVLKDQIITGNHLAQTSCQDKTARSVKYDRRHKVVRATADLSSGHYIGRLSIPANTFADKGDGLLLNISVGPVTIQRSVTALQPAKDAEHIFVKDKEGHVFRALVNSKTGK